LTLAGFLLLAISKICDRDGVASVEMASVSSPKEAWWSAAAAAQVVLPTPPFPVNIMILPLPELT
jgi:hypothetical protein